MLLRLADFYNKPIYHEQAAKEEKSKSHMHKIEQL